MLVNRQMQSEFMPELHRWISKLTARHLQIFHQEIFDHHGKGNGIFFYKKEFRKMKKSRISHWSESKREMTTRLPVTVSSVQTWFYM